MMRMGLRIFGSGHPAWPQDQIENEEKETMELLQKQLDSLREPNCDTSGGSEQIEELVNPHIWDKLHMCGPYTEEVFYEERLNLFWKNHYIGKFPCVCAPNCGVWNL